MASRKSGPKRVTAQHLERSALWHLERRALSTAQLRRILEKKVRSDESADVAWIDELLARFARAGLLDDKRVAAGRVAALHDRGTSARAIAMKLRQKGVDAATIDEAVSVVKDGAAELEAALAYVRRRRLRDKDPQKALQALARQGFTYAIAKKALQPT
jgi:regulatory protein